MKGLQGERLRQAFKYLDTNQDGFILPDQFKRIILVRCVLSTTSCDNSPLNHLVSLVGACWTQTIGQYNRATSNTMHPESRRRCLLF